MCTRLLQSVVLHKRRFKILERDCPYELVLSLRKANPKIDTSVVYNPSALPDQPMVPNIISTVRSTKTRRYRYKSESEALKYMTAIQKGNYCLRCLNHPMDCT